MAFYRTPHFHKLGMWQWALGLWNVVSMEVCNILCMNEFITMYTYIQSFHVTCIHDWFLLNSMHMSHIWLRTFSSYTFRNVIFVSRLMAWFTFSIRRLLTMGHWKELFGKRTHPCIYTYIKVCNWCRKDIWFAN